MNILLSPLIQVSFHIPMIGRYDQFIDVLCTHSFTTTIGCLNFNFLLFADSFNFLILALDVLKVHRLHINSHSLLVNFP